ncbi:MAG TPA: shikimate kinase, partial [Flavobacteriaceae bacterium]|nr:shikimate kinase [Flavobacteriaceae bacterium]
VTPQNLTQRLFKERATRPLIANLEEEKLEEYVRKHLFERQFYYLQSDVIIDANNKTVEDLVAEISNLFD